MNKKFKYYAACWLIFLAVFNALCFLTPNEVNGYVKIDATFWTAYAFITAAFIGNLICAYFAFKADTLQKLFYNVSLIRISYSGLIVMLIIASLTMAVPNLPSWIGMIVCLLVLFFTAMAVVKASAAAQVVSAVDEKVQNKTAFIKKLTADTQVLMETAKTDDVKAELRKVYEAVRYSDPMSDNALSDVEGKIVTSLAGLKGAAEAGETEKVRLVAEQFLTLIKERNAMCKNLK